MCSKLSHANCLLLCLLQTLSHCVYVCLHICVCVLLQLLRHGEYAQFWGKLRVNTPVSHSAQLLLQRLFIADARERPTFTDVSSDDWLIGDPAVPPQQLKVHVLLLLLLLDSVYTCCSVAALHTLLHAVVIPVCTLADASVSQGIMLALLSCTQAQPARSLQSQCVVTLSAELLRRMPWDSACVYYILYLYTSYSSVLCLPSLLLLFTSFAYCFELLLLCGTGTHGRKAEQCAEREEGSPHGNCQYSNCSL
jgi:hypothetical protein